MQAIRQRALVLLVLGILLGSGLHAAMVQKMDLSEVCERADKIFRGTVMSIEQGTVAAGGGRLPTVTYTIQVDEGFQGDFQTKGDRQFTKVTMLGQPKVREVNGARSFPVMRDLPQLEVGREYLLMTSRPSRIGLSAPIGLGQGCFTISGKGDAAIATDGLGNTYDYAALAADIRSAVDQ